MKLLRSVVAVAALSAAALPACSTDDVGTQSANQKDSFFQPTAHGELQFGVSNPATFTDEQRFHSWTFTLTDEAEVDLSTTIATTNLDTVMYLYVEGTGSYIAKNDDHAGRPESRITETLKAGVYTVKIKASKEFQRGSFAVTGACSGEGCPATDAGVCNAEGPLTMPSRTGYTQACEDALYAILTTPAATAPAGCADSFSERSVAYYKEYWNDLVGWDEVADGREPDVAVKYHPGAGAVVQVGLGGDEDAMDFVFNVDGDLIYFYQHNQSPDWAWFCAGDTELSEPDEACVREITYNSSYGASDVTTGEGAIALGDDLSSLPPQVVAAIEDYTVDMDPGTDVSFTYDIWSAYYVDGASIGFTSSARQHMTYVILGDPEYGMTITYVTDEDGTSLWCQEL